MLRRCVRQRTRVPPATQMHRILGRGCGGAASAAHGTQASPNAYSSGSNTSVANFTTSKKVEDAFGYNVFGERRMMKRLPAGTFARFKECVSQRKPIDREVAEVMATALKDWCNSRGVTHFAHWFQPLTHRTAEKHDSFIKPSDKHVIVDFSGSKLLHGEPDASSFPGGGLRETHEARGYTLWDPSSPPFIMNQGGVPTLFIPACFFSWKGHALDNKIPLLRSDEAVQREILRLMAAIGDHRHTSAHTESGIEQEFFLVDRDQFQQRHDLRLCGRALQGAAPPKGQELSDSYFGPLTSQVWACIQDMETAMWELGIPVTTRHREVAPNQYELAPIFERASVASDHNLVLMEVAERVAARHGLTAVFHEKPFAGVNGSGKHNNWSVGTNAIPTLFEPGPDPANNTPFLLAVAAVVRAADLHPELIRYAISGAGNDHRLGANEAPPAIVSVFLGDELQGAIDAVVHDRSPVHVDRTIDLGVSYLPTFERHPTDRNRTSPFAFVGNKFEVRAVGSSHAPALSNTTLNAVFADSCRYLTDRIEAAKAGGSAVEVAVRAVLREVFVKHGRIIFNGNNYDPAWVEEAERRGLPNLRTTPDALNAAESKSEVFESLGILSRDEYNARVAVARDNYVKHISHEGHMLRQMATQGVLPLTLRQHTELVQGSTAGPGVQAHAKTVGSLTSLGYEQVHGLTAALHALEAEPDLKQRTSVAVDQVIPAMQALRSTLDALELDVETRDWPWPRLTELLFRSH